MGSFALGRSARNSLQNATGAGQRIVASMPGLGVVVMVIALVLLTILLGAVVALGALQLTLLLTGLIMVVPFLLFISSKNMLPLLFAAVFVIQGLGQYFLQMRMLTWMATGMGALLFGRAILEIFFASPHKQVQPHPGAGRVVAAVSLYMAFYFFSMSLGSATPTQIVSAVRFALPMYGVMFAMYWFHWSTARLETLWWMIVAIMVIQLPFATYQHFFMMSKLGWDGVVGTMGSNMSPMLVIFSLSAALFVLARWSHGLTSGWKAGLTISVFLAIVLLGEVKAVVLWIPLGILIVLRRRVLRNILAFATFCIFITLFVVSTFTVYNALYWGEHAQGDSITEKFDSTSGYILDADGINYRTGEVSRMASMALWYNDPVPTVVERLVGYGPGASANNRGTGRGVVAQRYGILQLNASAVSLLLWDTGILGALAYASILLAILITGWKLTNRQNAPPEARAIADASFAVLILLMTTIVYNRLLMDESSAQLLFFFCAGCIVQLTRYPRVSAAIAADTNQPVRAHAGRVLHVMPTPAIKGARR
jgi:hypothetical protein